MIMLNSQTVEVKSHLQDADYIRSHTNELIQTCVQKYNSEEIKLYDIVEGLQPSLTNKSPVERALGVQFLADVLQGLTSEKVNTQEITFLSQFFIDRLRDQHSVVPHAIVGIIALIRQENILGQDVQFLIQALFREVSCQSQILADRRNIYSLIKFCVLNKIEDIKNINDQFILGFISAVEGEKDPRNLVLLFSFFPNVAKELNLKDFAEDLFELVAAYFPIDFVPPKRDGFVVTVEDLTEGLRRCLSSTEEFAPFLIPLLQEKLDSDVVAAKIECFLTLQACCSNYHASFLRPHVPLLWLRLRREVIEGWKEELERAAIVTLSCLVGALEKDPSCRNAIDELGSSVMMECVPHLSTPEQRLVFPSMELLLAASKCSASLSEKFCEKVLPLLIDQFRVKTEAIARKNTVIVMAKFLARGAEFNGFTKGSSETLLSIRDTCFEVLLEALQSSDKSVKEAAAVCLAPAMRAFNSEQIKRAGIGLTQLLMGTVEYNLRKPVVDALISAGKADISVLENDVLPLLLSAVVNAGQVEDRTRLEYLLEALSSVCFSPETLKKALTTLWDEILRLSVIGDGSVVYFIRCLNHMINGLDLRRQECVEFLAKEWNGVAKCHHLTSFIIKSKQFCDPGVILEQISSIRQSLIMSTSSEQVLKLLDAVLYPERIFEFGEVSDFISESGHPLPNPVDEKDIDTSLYVYCTQDLIMRYDVISERGDIEKLLSLLREWTRAEDPRVRKIAATTFSLYVMNIPSDSELVNFLKPLEKEFDFFGREENEMDVTSSVLLLGWIVKSLIMRAYSGDLFWIQKLENLLLDPTEIGEKASQCYSFLLKEDAFQFSSPKGRPKSIKVLYQQRFFERRIGHLVRQFRETEGGRGKDNTLLAISYLLPYLPQTVLKGHLENLLPVLVCGLQSTESVVTSGAVETLSCLLKSHHGEGTSLINAADVTSQLCALVPSLLSLARNSTVAVRVKSLKCIEALAQLPPIDLMPYKTEVIQGLKLVLNDKKRMVRRAAASARSAWVLL